MNAHPSFPDPADDHPPVEQLADLAEGLVDSPGTVDALRRHLDGCAECRETVDALAEVRALLGDVETPPMPADIAARLDAALAEAVAEATEAAGSDREAAERPQEGPAADRRPEAPTRPVRTATAPLTPSSAPPSRPAGRPAGRSGPATGPGRPRRRRFALLIGTAAALAALGLGGALLLHPDDRSGTVTASAGGAPTATADSHDARAPHAAAGTDYREDELATQVRQLLARSENAPGLRATGPAMSEGALPADGARPESDPPSPAGSPTASSTAPGCPAPASGTPLATDRGGYHGAPVDVLVYPLPGRPGFVDVYLRSPDCGPILLHQAVPSH
ncbi:hypothetical protein ACFU6K_24395 [Kitasatospora sp. NPDC057512]|uniref:hypothetical protein n=1 Tax=Kitasatospora sp. NPDC057512 TaxID=3346154 RepID=UPI0036782DBC